MSLKPKTVESASQKKPNNLLVLGVIVAVVVIAAVVMIVLSMSNTTALSSDALSDIPRNRADDGAFVLGNPEAPITVIEFADFFCPACQQYKSDINTLIENEVKAGRAKFEYRMIVTAGGANMTYAGQMAECADELRPGSFWEAYEVLYDMASRNAFGNNASSVFAERMGLEVGELIACTRDSDQVDIDSRYARSLGVSSTPTVLVKIGDGTPQEIPGGRNYNFLKAFIDTASSVIPQ